jgi:hypothetical protein
LISQTGRARGEAGMDWGRQGDGCVRELPRRKKAAPVRAGLEGGNRVLQLAREHVAIVNARVEYRTKIPFIVIIVT